MLLLILPLVYGLLWKWFRRISYNWRQAILWATLVFGALLTAITELLSLLSHLEQAWIFGSWFFVALGLLGWNHKTLRNRNDNLLMTWLNPRPNRLYRSATSTNQQNGALIQFSVLSLLLLIGITGYIALLAPPNTYDVLTYHIARVMNWIQNDNVAHYPTRILRQLDVPPWSSFAILHGYLLGGSDRFVNGWQWCSMVGSVIGVSLIAKELGANAVGQVLASVLCATLPLGILQASTTQNDYIASFWLLNVAYHSLLLIRRSYHLPIAWALGISVGLAMLTKTTAYFYSAPFLLWVGIVALQQNGWRSWRLLTAIGIPICLINAGHWVRNFIVFGSPLGSSGDNAKAHIFTLAAFLSNVIKNIGLHLAIAFPPINHLSEKAILAIHQFLRIDINATNFRSSFSIPLQQSHLISLNENNSGNPVHLALIFIALIVYLYHQKIRRPIISIYILCIVSGFLILCLLVEWIPSATRYHLPLFVLFCALIGTLFSQLQYHINFQYLGIALLILLSIPYVLFARNRPLLVNSFSQAYFITAPIPITQVRQRSAYLVNEPALFQEFQQAFVAIEAQSCQQIGLDLSPDSVEYLLWSFFNERWLIHHQPLPLFQSVQVDARIQQRTPHHPSRQGIPCAIFRNNRFKPLPYEPSYILQDTAGKSQLYTLGFHSDFAQVYFLAPTPTIPPKRFPDGLEN